jgi:hypothetical protein
MQSTKGEVRDASEHVDRDTIRAADATARA